MEKEISRSDVLKVYNELKSSSVQPTVKRIHERVGGSYESILGHLTDIINDNIDASIAALINNAAEELAIGFNEVASGGRLVRELPSPRPGKRFADLAVAKADLREANDRVAALEEEARRLGDRLAVSESARASLMASWKEDLLELGKLRFQEEGFLQARQEAEAAKAKAAQLEGRILESDSAKQELETKLKAYKAQIDELNIKLASLKKSGA